MKRVSVKSVCLMLLIVLVAAAAFPAFAQSREGAYVVTITEPHDRLNVHSTPSKGNVFAHLDDGTVVMYQYSDDGWWHVEWRTGNGTFASGYVDDKYLVPITQDKSAKYVCVDNLYVHSQSDIAFGSCASYHIDQLKAGDKVSVLKQDGTWSFVKYGEKTGWVASLYLVEA